MRSFHKTTRLEHFLEYIVLEMERLPTLCLQVFLFFCFFSVVLLVHDFSE